METKPVQLDWPARIQRAKRLIESDLGKTHALDDLAKAAYASPFHFHRVFRGLTGETVQEYSRRLRLERAAMVLKERDDGILAIALDSGYESHEAFTRAFKKHFSVTPSDYRAAAKPVQQASEQKERSVSMDITIQTRERSRIACVRHVGPYTEAAEAWKALMKWGWTKMLFGKPKTFGLCFDDPDVTPPDKLRYEACMEVGPKTSTKGPVEIRDLEAGTYAVTVHRGPYDSFSETYALLCAALVTERLDGATWELAAPPSLEVYLNDPRSTAPADLKTEIWLPVNKKA